MTNEQQKLLTRESLAGLGTHECAFTDKPSTKLSKKMKKQNYLCVDLTTQMKKRNLQVKNEANGVLRRDGEEHFTFVERGAKAHEERPELHWRLLDRTKHGRVHVNARHVKVEFYIHHDDYANGCALADMLASEIETLGEHLSELDMAEEVSRCI